MGHAIYNIIALTKYVMKFKKGVVSEFLDFFSLKPMRFLLNVLGFVHPK